MLVTGATGFIGSRLVHCLLEQGYRVSVLVRPGSSTWRLGDSLARVRVCVGNLLDSASLVACLRQEQPDIVFHLAADTSSRRWSPQLDELDTSIDTNLKGTLHLVKAVHALGLRPRFVRAGGLAEYGGARLPFEECDRETPLSAYGASQAATTAFLGALRYALPFPLITLRLASVYGPGRATDFFLPSLIVHCLEGRDFHMSNGDQIWDIVYVDDVVDAFLRAARRHLESGEVINIGCGRGHTLREIAEFVVRKTGTRSQIRGGAIAASAGDIPHLYCNNSRARELLGWVPTTPLDTGLDRTIDWYRQHLAEAKLAVEASL